MIRPTNVCSLCGGETSHQQVEEVLRGGTDTAVVTAEADVCLGCGERFYRVDTIRRFEKIRAKLESHDTADLTPVGRSFQVN